MLSTDCKVLMVDKGLRSLGCSSWELVIRTRDVLLESDPFQLLGSQAWLAAVLDGQRMPGL